MLIKEKLNRDLFAQVGYTGKIPKDLTERAAVAIKYKADTYHYDPRWIAETFLISHQLIDYFGYGTGRISINNNVMQYGRQVLEVAEKLSQFEERITNTPENQRRSHIFYWLKYNLDLFLDENE